jgi:hypothetical protein
MGTLLDECLQILGMKSLLTAIMWPLSSLMSNHTISGLCKSANKDAFLVPVRHLLVCY